MKDAERLLVESAAGAFVYHPLVGQLQKPYRMGSLEGAQRDRLHRRPVARRRAAMTLVYDTLYQGADVVTMRKA